MADRRARTTSRRAASTALLALIVGLTGCASASPGSPDAAASRGGQEIAAAARRPNVVFILTDDLSTNLLRYMPNVLSLQRRGMTFTNYTVTDSLCCPSRASIFTGRFPHNTKVFSNTGPDGGWSKFQSTGDENDTFATEISAGGYRTNLLGKYLNGYRPVLPDGTGAYVPPGWTSWGGVNGGGYNEYNYRMAVNGAVRTYGSDPSDYLTTVMTQRADRFVASASRQALPFFLELATFSPHAPYVPAPQDLGTFAQLNAPRPPSFGVVPINPPRWMQQLTPLSQADRNRIDRAFRRRVESVQSVDRMVGAVEDRLRRVGELQNTVIVFSSDNGYHMGEHDLRPGKQTAFDTDIRVPLIVAGPGIAVGTSNAIVENIDLAPTFDELAGASAPASTDGRSLVPLLHGERPPWRTLALIEHQGDPFTKNDPDGQHYAQGNAPSYDAIRSATYTYIRYRSSGEREYYNRVTDPWEQRNVIGHLSTATVRTLDRELTALRSCHGADRCWQAGRPSS